MSGDALDGIAVALGIFLSFGVIIVAFVDLFDGEGNIFLFLMLGAAVFVAWRLF